MGRFFRSRAKTRKIGHTPTPNGNAFSSKSNKSGSPYGVLINIDEVGSAKGMESQRNYAIVASKITDRFAFANAVQDVAIKNGIRHELSFTGDRALRGEIMNAIVEYVDSVNYVYAHRPVGYEFEINPKMIHKQLLSSLTGMLDFEKGEDVLIFVDSNDDLISDETVKQILNPDGNRNIVCLVLPSRYFYELQGHDIITGAIGMELNSSDSQYSDILREHDRRITGKKVDFKLRRRQ